MNETIQKATNLVDDVLNDALRGGREYVVLFLVEQIQTY